MLEYRTASFGSTKPPTDRNPPWFPAPWNQYANRVVTRITFASALINGINDEVSLRQRGEWEHIDHVNVELSHALMDDILHLGRLPFLQCRTEPDMARIPARDSRARCLSPCPSTGKATGACKGFVINHRAVEAWRGRYAEQNAMAADPGEGEGQD
jgi:hypothetical protein